MRHTALLHFLNFFFGAFCTAEACLFQVLPVLHFGDMMLNRFICFTRREGW